MQSALKASSPSVAASGITKQRRGPTRGLRTVIEAAARPTSRLSAGRSRDFHLGSTPRLSPWRQASDGPGVCGARSGGAYQESHQPATVSSARMVLCNGSSLNGRSKGAADNDGGRSHPAGEEESTAPSPAVSTSETVWTWNEAVQRTRPCRQSVTVTYYLSANPSLQYRPRSRFLKVGLGQFYITTSQC